MYYQYILPSQIQSFHFVVPFNEKKHLVSIQLSGWCCDLAHPFQSQGYHENIFPCIIFFRTAELNIKSFAVHIAKYKYVSLYSLYIQVKNSLEFIFIYGAGLQFHFVLIWIPHHPITIYWKDGPPHPYSAGLTIPTLSYKIREVD